MSALFIGDIHGDFKKLDEILRDEKAFPDTPIIQVGDLGIGFPRQIDVSTGKPFREDPKGFDPNFRFIRGNHDNPEACSKYPGYLGDFGFDYQLNMFFMSGASSIDRHVRIRDVSWWENEELSIPAMYQAHQLYRLERPSIVVTHTCPTIVAQMLIGGPVAGDRTSQALQSMWEEHKPNLWVFGHWHVDWQRKLLGTKFVCLAPNSTYWISHPLS